MFNLKSTLNKANVLIKNNRKLEMIHKCYWIVLTIDPYFIMKDWFSE